LGIARRTVSVEFEQKTIRLTHHKNLLLNIKTIGNWIYCKRIGRNLSPGHLAAKMGIAAALIYAWEDGISPERGANQDFGEDIWGDISASLMSGHRSMPIASAMRSSISRVGLMRPFSMRAMVVWEMPARFARAYMDNPCATRFSRS
jgi:hypothetical protein